MPSPKTHQNILVKKQRQALQDAFVIMQQKDTLMKRMHDLLHVKEILKQESTHINQTLRHIKSELSRSSLPASSRKLITKINYQPGST